MTGKTWCENLAGCLTILAPVLCGILLGIAIGTVSLIQIQKQYRQNLEINMAVEVKEDPYHLFLAQEIDSFFADNGIRTNARVIREAVEAVSDLLPIYFPKGEFTMSDILTIAFHEGGFKKKARGKAGEVGMFQILEPWAALKGIGKKKADPWDPRTNAEMGLYVLKTKYDKHKNMKKSIMAYNGLINGRNEKYWNIFVKKRKTIRRLMNASSRTYHRAINAPGKGTKYE